MQLPPHPAIVGLGEDDETFEHCTGGVQTCQQQVAALRKNGHIMIQGRPCKIVEMSTSKAGKHGQPKVHFVALDIFTGDKYEDILPSIFNVDVPNIVRKDYQMVSIDDGVATLMDDEGETREDLKVPDG